MFLFVFFSSSGFLRFLYFQLVFLAIFTIFAPYVGIARLFLDLVGEVSSVVQQQKEVYTMDTGRFLALVSSS